MIVFNLSTNLDDPILATAHLWLKGFESQTEKLYVYSTHVGRTDLSKDTKVFETGGGSLFLRVKAIFRLTKSLRIIIRKRKQIVVLHHMSSRTAVFPGVLIRLLGVPQGLWYSHSKAPISLKIALFIVDEIFSSTPNSFPIHTKKLKCIGHGIDTEVEVDLNTNRNRSQIGFLGRISPIKRLDFLIYAVSKLSESLKIVVTGASDVDGKYKKKIMKLAEASKVEIEINDEIPHNTINDFLSKFYLVYSGMLNSVDKSAIEAAINGCFIVTLDKNTQELTGMIGIWNAVNPSEDLNLDEQINVLKSFTLEEEKHWRSQMVEVAKSKNDYRQLTEKIAKTLRSHLK